MNEKISLDSLLTAEEVAKILNLHPHTVYRLTREKKLPCLRIGRTMRFHREVIETFVRSKPDPGKLHAIASIEEDGTQNDELNSIKRDINMVIKLLEKQSETLKILRDIDMNESTGNLSSRNELLSVMLYLLGNAVDKIEAL